MPLSKRRKIVSSLVGMARMPGAGIAQATAHERNLELAGRHAKIVNCRGEPFRLRPSCGSGALIASDSYTSCVLLRQVQSASCAKRG